MQEQDLKTLQPSFEELWEERKTFEIRKDDRDYNVGDILNLNEYNAETKEYSGRSVMRVVSHILRNAPEYGVLPKYCILSFKAGIGNRSFNPKKK